MQYYNLFGISKCYTKRYDINISNGQIGMSPAYSFNCYDIKSIFNLIHHSKANIYVTKSFLLFNNWTINRFCKEYNISMEMVQLIMMETNVKICIVLNFRKPFYEKGKHMQEYYKIYFLIPKNIYWNRLRRLQNHYVFQTRLIEIWHLQPTKKRIIPYVSDMQQEV